MLDLAPLIRLVSAAALLGAALAARSPDRILGVYLVVLVVVGLVGVVARHLRFVALVTLPLLAALLVVWGWLLPPSQVPSSYHNGVSFAVSTWLRVTSCGGIFQALLIPLIDHPTGLRRFLRDTRVPSSIAQVVLSAVIFLPEVGRRLTRISEARAAQGHAMGAIDRVLSLPAMLTPLVSSLMDTAVRRAEFWGHRGVLDRQYDVGPGVDDPLKSTVAVVISFSTLAFAVWR